MHNAMRIETAEGQHHSSLFIVLHPHYMMGSHRHAPLPPRPEKPRSPTTDATVTAHRVYAIYCLAKTRINEALFLVNLQIQDGGTYSVV